MLKRTLTWPVVVAVLIAAVGVSSEAQAEVDLKKGLVAHYAFDEGKDTVLHDKSGNGNDGTIHGATWVRNGTLHALELDGRDDYVESAGKGLNLSKALSIGVWVLPLSTPGPGQGERPLIGKTFDSYLITHFRDGSSFFYVGGGPNNTMVRLKEKAWNHLVATFDGKDLRMYLNGRLAAQSPSKFNTIPQVGNFRLGSSSIASQFIRKAHFHGRLAEVRVYNRALHPQEVAEHFRTTNLNGAVTLRAVAAPLVKKVFVELDARGVGRDAAQKIALAVRPKGSKRPLIRKRVTEWDGRCRAHVSLDARDLKPGRYAVVALVGGVASVSEEIEWSAIPPFPRGKAGARRLNNLVTELLNTDVAAGDARTFLNPRNGWVYVSSTHAVDVRIRGQGQDLTTALVKGPGTTLEAMHFLPAGAYAVSADGATHLIVRAIPRLAFCKFPESSRIRGFGKITWDVFKRRWADNTNVVIGQQYDSVEGIGKVCGEAIREWRALGRRWIIEMPASTPYLTGNLGVKMTPKGLYDYLANGVGFRYPGLSGVLLDEFESSDSDEYAAWKAASDRIHAEPKFAGRKVHLYCGPMVHAERSRRWLKKLIAGGSTFVLERYCPEMPTEAEAWDYLHKNVLLVAREHEEKLPGSVRSMVIVWGTFNASWEILNNYPAVDGKVYMDMQFNMAANAPEFLDMHGFQGYGTSNTTPEMQRWVSRLYRHYGIEGKTGMLSSDPYRLEHIRNPDFEEGAAGWTLRPAETGSLEAGFFGGFGALQGRSPLMGAGNHCLITSRSAKGPNSFSQTIRNLQPGRTYSLRMFTGDRKKMLKELHAVRIRIDNAEMLAEHTLQEPTYNYFSAAGYGGGYDKKDLAWPNFHWRVFRAKGPTAELTVSDWLAEDNPGGAVGQELMYNFIEIQPFFMDQEVRTADD